MKTHSAVYLQSGGPTSVINASLYGYVKQCLSHSEISKIYGAKFGIDGLIRDDLIDLSSLEEEQLELLLQTPGSALGSSRHRLKADDEETFQAIEATLKRHDIDLVFVNGGNDSMDTCAHLAKRFPDIKVIGIPKTVDNDLDETDHCPGYGSCCKSIIDNLRNLSIDISSYDKGKVTIVEVIGRDAGWLTASTALIEEPYAPDYVYLPEMDFDLDIFLKQIEKTYQEKKRVLVAISEGVKALQGDPLFVDEFGHGYQEGFVHVLAKMVTKKLGIPSRGIGLSLLSRCDISHISKADQQEAIDVTSYAVKLALKGETSKMVTIHRESNRPYRSSLQATPVEKIAGETRYFPSSWIIGPGQIDVPAFKEYLAPLLEGDVIPERKEGQIVSALLFEH